MIALLVLLPAVAGGLAFVLRGTRCRRYLWVATAVAHAALTAAAWWVRPPAELDGWLKLDAPGLLFLTISSVLFLAAALYGVDYLARQPTQAQTDFEEGVFFSNAPEAVFIGCLLFFLAAMSLVTVSHHFGLLWIGVEATTLASAPLIYFHRHHRSLEATWKYLLVCSVGIALALLGNFFLAVAAARPGALSLPLVVDRLVESAAALRLPWLQAGFILLLVGYGTKMGLAPLHTWLPDAHSEAPSVISALLSGALLNCAFLAILRGYQVCAAAGQAAFAQDMLVTLGLFSMGTAAVFIFGQTDYKRLLAYSSVEHMGILALGTGLGGLGTTGALLHALNHSLAKAMLFLVAGNILNVFQTKTISHVRGLRARLPVSAALWVAGLLAITGSPPFGLFLSEFTILKAAVASGQWLVAAVYLLFLALIFIGMSAAMLSMAQGRGEAGSTAENRPEPVGSLGPPLALGTCVLCLGLWVPDGLWEVLVEAARILGNA